MADVEVTRARVSGAGEGIEAVDVPTFQLGRGSTWGSFLSEAGCVDYAGNTFDAHVEETADGGFVGYITKRAPDGTVLGEWRARPVPGMKADSVDIFGSGSDLIVDLSEHEPHADPRAVYPSRGRIVGVFAPYPQGFAPMGRAGAYVPGGRDPGPQYTLDEIANAVRNKLTDEMAVDSEFKKKLSNTIRRCIKDEVKDAESALLTKKNLYGGEVPEGYDDFIRNRVWEVLDDNGLVTLFFELHDWLNRHP